MARLVRADDTPPVEDQVAYWRHRLEQRDDPTHADWWAGVPEPEDEDGAVSFEIARRRRQARGDGAA